MDVPQNVIHISKYLFRNEEAELQPHPWREHEEIYSHPYRQTHAHIPTASATVMSIIKQKNIKSNIYSISFLLRIHIRE